MKHKNQIILLGLIYILAACAPMPSAPAQEKAPPLQIIEIEARHTQEYIAAAHTATAVIEHGAISTQIAIEHGTALAVEVSHTQIAVEAEQAKLAATMRADEARSLAAQKSASATATAVALVFNANATATKAVQNATGTALAAQASTFATQQAAEQKKIEMTNTFRSWAPWVAGTLLVLVLIYFIHRVGQAKANQGNVIRDARGDVHTVIFEGLTVPPRAVNTEKAIGPVIQLGKIVGAPQLPASEQQERFATNDQIIRLEKARALLERNPRTKDPEIINQIVQGLGHQPHALPSMQSALPSGMAQPRLQTGSKIIHPRYGIDPRTLPEIPVFDVGSRLMAGGSRSGKTNLAQYDIHRMRIEDVCIFDPKYRAGKWPAHAQIITEPAELLGRLNQQDAEFKERRDGQQNGFPQMLTIVDEYTALVELQKMSGSKLAIKDAIAMAWALIMYGAEFNCNVWILSQGGNAASLGLSGRGDLRNSLTRIDFLWRPDVKSEMGIPRIAEVSTADSVVKYYVPEFKMLPAANGAGNTPEQLWEQVGTVGNGAGTPRNTHAELGTPRNTPEHPGTPDLDVFVQSLAGSPEAEPFTPEQLSRAICMVLAGESANRICNTIQRRRVDVYGLVGKINEIKETQLNGEIENEIITAIN